MCSRKTWEESFICKPVNGSVRFISPPLFWWSLFFPFFGSNLIITPFSQSTSESQFPVPSLYCSLFPQRRQRKGSSSQSTSQKNVPPGKYPFHFCSGSSATVVTSMVVVCSSDAVASSTALDGTVTIVLPLGAICVTFCMVVPSPGRVSS